MPSTLASQSEAIAKVELSKITKIIHKDRDITNNISACYMNFNELNLQSGEFQQNFFKTKTAIPIDLRKLVVYFLLIFFVQPCAGKRQIETI